MGPRPNATSAEANDLPRRDFPDVVASLLKTCGACCHGAHLS
jgi:hypothetical protein